MQIYSYFYYSTVLDSVFQLLYYLIERNVIMPDVTKTKVYTVREYEKQHRPLPKSLIRAAGLLKHKRKALERHLQEVRNEWDRHSKSG